MQPDSAVIVRWLLLCSAAMLFGHASAQQLSSVKSVRVCAAGDCGLAANRYSTEQMLTALHRLLSANDALEYRMCESDTRSRQCIAENLGHTVFALVFPGQGTQSSGTIRNPQMNPSGNAIRMNKSDPKQFSGSAVTCSDHGGTITANASGEIVLTDDPYSCRWGLFGVMTAEFSFTIESIDLEKGRITGFWSHKLTGTGHGSGTGFAAFQFQKGMPHGEDWLGDQTMVAGTAGGAARSPEVATAKPFVEPILTKPVTTATPTAEPIRARPTGTPSAASCAQPEIQAARGSTPQPSAESRTAAPALVVQIGYSGGVRAMSFSSSGKYLASAGKSDPTVRLWEMAHGHELRSFATGLVEAISFNSDDSLMAVTRRRDIQLWDPADGRLVRSLAHEGMRQTLRPTLAFSPAGNTLAAGYHRAVVIWDAGTGQKQHTIAAHDGDVTAIAFSPDGRWLVSGGTDKTVKVWNIETGTLARTLSGHSQEVRNLAFSRSGSMVASFSPLDTSAAVWEFASGRLVRTLPSRSSFLFEGRPFSFSTDERWLIYGGTRSSLATWEIATGGSGTPPPGSPLEGIVADDRRFELGAISYDQQWLALSDSADTRGEGGEIRIWQFANGRLRHRLKGSPGIHRTASSPDGRWLASNGWSNGAVMVWEVASGRVLHLLSGHSRHITSINFSPDSRSLFVSNWYGDVKRTHIWDVITGRQVRVMNDVLIANLSSNGEMYETRRSGKHGERLVHELWSLATGKKLTVLDPENQGSANKYLFFTPDGKNVVTASEFERVVLWELETGRELTTITTKPRWGVALSPDGRWLAAGMELLRDGIRLFDLKKEQETRTLAGLVGQMRFSPDGCLLATWRGSEAALLDVASGRERQRLTGHSGDIRLVVFTPDSRLVISTGADGTTRIWDASSGAQLATLLSVGDSGEWLVVTPDGYFDGSPAGWSQAMWRFSERTFDVAPIEAFFSEYFYPGLLTEILAGRTPKPIRSIAQLDRRQPAVKVSLDGPQDMALRKIANRTTKVKIEITEARSPGESVGSGARDVRLFRNGALVRIWRGDALSGKSGKATLEAAIPIVSGENRLTAYAFNRDNIKSADATIAVTGAETLKRPGTAHILVVGVNEYANRDFNLKYAVADAKALGDEMLLQQSKLGAYGRVEVIPLLDRDATKANVLGALERLAGASTLPPGAPAALRKVQPAQPEDAVIVYFAGHGIADGPRFYLVPHDLGYTGARMKLDEGGLKMLLSHSVSDLELEKAFEKVDAGRVILVIDACESGQALEADEKRRGPMNSKGLAQLAYEKGMYVLTAAQGYQAALEAEKLGHGLFTYALVEEGLKSPAADTAPKDGQVAVREWFDFATLRVPELQMGMMEEARKQGREIVFVDGERSISELTKRSLQRPRAFYRPDAEATPFIVAKPVAK